MEKNIPDLPGPKDTRAELVAMMKSSAPMVVLTEDVSRTLVDESSSPEAATEWHRSLVTEYGKPLGVNLDNYTTIISSSGCQPLDFASRSFLPCRE